MKKLIMCLIISMAFIIVGCAGVDAAMPEKCFVFDKRTKTITKLNDIYVNGRYCAFYDEIEIPSTIKGVAVEKIGAGAFSENALRDVILPDGLKEIGDKAFYNNKLTSISIPDSVEYIGEAAFNDNPMSELIYDPSDDTKVVSVAYENLNINCDSEFVCEDDVITIPSTVKTIGSNAFYGLRLTRVNIEDGVQVLEEEALHGAYIENLKLPTTLTSADLSVDYNEFAEEYDGKIFSHFWCTTDGKCPYTFANYTDASFTGNKYNLKANYNPIGEPEVYVYQKKYNKVELEFESDNYNFSEVEVYKYNSKTKKYYLHTKTTKKYSMKTTKDIVLGENNYFKIRLVYKNLPYINNNGTISYKTVYSNYSDIDYDKVMLDGPTKLKAKKLGNLKVKLTWKKVDGATGYTIYKYDSKTKKYKALGNTTKLSYTTKKKNKKGKKSYYKVKAYRTVNGKKVYGYMSDRVGVKVK